MRWVLSENPDLKECSESCEAASEIGNLEVLKEARALGCEWNELACEAAAGGGHLEVLQWARAQGCPWNEMACAFARWARENGCPWDEKTFEEAVRGGHHTIGRRWAWRR
jgi:hypothetical protein